ncbi:efflux transporter outer membrane subunit [Prosthecobacter vanneervenii]|uniref:Multidrug efflux system outer membrane protein n=1 Tax=Prosthecobacter vanneervenii TaxID=48466 RepID=A0A7W7YFA6_9BACT|nr:efflux transporter outer membrane subunit [Prosthecobacter vanneervenii]MBB5034800.1 multidrug efflux system outer membrane protein [Prosthecobacter vanneervenii]
MKPTSSLLFIVCLVSSCNVGPKFVKPRPKMPADYASRSTQEQRAHEVDTAWWRKLNDSTLNELVAQAEAQNKDIAAARARLLEARALWRESRFNYAPTVTLGSTYENTRSGATSFSGLRTRDYELYRTGFDADWELDFFGRIRNSVKAAKANSSAMDTNLQDLLISLQSEVASNYMELRGAQAQLTVANENASNQRDALHIAEASLKGGRGTQLDVARANALWNATMAQIPTYQENVARSIHRIAVLCGQNPSELRAKLQVSKKQPAVPGHIGIVKPAELLRRRPDIRTAENILAAETARIGVAVADLFPRVTFNGRIGFEAASLAYMGDRPNADGYSFGPRITWAAFNLGRVKQQIAAAGKRADAALARYEQTVLLALEEAENALTVYDRERLRLRHLEASAASAREAATLARKRYQDGIADFLTVLDAERMALGAQNDIVVSRTRVATAWVTIYKAMGGGWNG